MSVYASGLRNPNGLAWEPQTGALWTVVDERVKPANLELVASARVPDYALGPHTASLGLVFYDADELRNYRGGAFVSQHGSWNRKPQWVRYSLPTTSATRSGASRRAERFSDSASEPVPAPLSAALAPSPSAL